MGTFGSMIKKSSPTRGTSAVKNVRGKMGIENKAMKTRSLSIPKVTRVKPGDRHSIGKSVGTKPSQKNSIGNMSAEMKTISRGVKAIANRTSSPRQKSMKYTVGQLGKAAHQPTARK